MLQYVLTVSKVFPSYHKRKGEQTNFIPMIGQKSKIHTIRGNYDYWARRFDKIYKGEACLSVRAWEGTAYHSPQKEYFNFNLINDGIGIQKLTLDDYLYTCDIDGKRFCFSSDLIPEHDGLNTDDFESWFYKYDFSKPMAIIHFTDFRYK